MRCHCTHCIIVQNEDTTHSLNRFHEYMGAPTNIAVIAEERTVEWWSDTVSHIHPSPLRSWSSYWETNSHSPNWERRRRRYCNVTGLAYLFTIGSNIWNCLKISHHINLFTCNVSTQHTSLTYPSNRNSKLELGKRGDDTYVKSVVKLSSFFATTQQLSLNDRFWFQFNSRSCDPGPLNLPTVAAKPTRR